MAPQILTEDEIYRSSTQYRLWSFTPETLASLRETTNKTAAEQVLSSIESHDASNSTTEKRSILTPLEELTLLNHHTHHLLRNAVKHLNLPTPVAATGAIYLKRFYLSHSPLTYPADAVMPTCLFLATKTEHYYVPLSAFAKKWKPEIQPEDIIREEGTVTQALRFCFDVHHPFRGLRGALMELRATAEGKAGIVPGSGMETAQDAQNTMRRLPPRPNPQSHSDDDSTPDDAEEEAAPQASVKQAQARAFQAHDRAKEILASSALLSDACFLFTPAQMMFATLLVADEPLALFYLSTKLPRRADPIDDAAVAAGAFADKLLRTIRTCATMFTSVRQPSHEIAGIKEKVEESRRLLDADSAEDLNSGGKRNGVEIIDEQGQSAKKRKLDGEQGKSPFGDPLTGSMEMDT